MTQVAPITIIRPPKTKREKFVFSRPSSQRGIGSVNQSTSASPAAVRTGLSGRPASERSGTALSTSTETPTPRATASFAWTPAQTKSTPSRIPTVGQSQRRLRFFAAAGSGRLRIAETMFMRLTRRAE